MNKKLRNSSIEILRIISIILIVIHHYAIHGFDIGNLPYHYNQYLISVLGLGGKLGVVCFILISGYYMCESKISVKKILKLIAEAWFYMVAIGLLFLFVLRPVEPITKIDLIKIFIPIVYNQNWFITDYILLMIVSPLLNILIKNLDKKLYKSSMFLGVIIWGILPNFIIADLSFNSFIYFMLIYLIAGYIKKYINIENGKKYHNLVLAFLNYFVIIISSIVLIYFGHLFNMPIFTRNSIHFSALQSPFILLTGIELLLFFLKLKPFTNKLINKVASTTLGIYLIHDNFLMRPYLWGGVY